MPSMAQENMFLNSGRSENIWSIAQIDFLGVLRVRTWRARCLSTHEKPRCNCPPPLAWRDRARKQHTCTDRRFSQSLLLFPLSIFSPLSWFSTFSSLRFFLVSLQLPRTRCDVQMRQSASLDCWSTSLPFQHAFACVTIPLLSPTKTLCFCTFDLHWVFQRTRVMDGPCLSG